MGGIPNESGFVERAVSFDKGVIGDKGVERISARGGGRHKICRIRSDGGASGPGSLLASKKWQSSDRQPLRTSDSHR